MAGAMTFSLGCVLKTELRRRAEVRSNLFLLNLHSPKALWFFVCLLLFFFLHFYISGGANSSLIVKLSVIYCKHIIPRSSYWKVKSEYTYRV